MRKQRTPTDPNLREYELYLDGLRKTAKLSLTGGVNADGLVEVTEPYSNRVIFRAVQLPRVDIISLLTATVADFYGVGRVKNRQGGVRVDTYPDLPPMFTVTVEIDDTLLEG